MSPSWRGPRPGSSPSVPKRDDEITRRVGLPSPDLKAEVYEHKTDAEVAMAFATCQELRRDLRAMADERDTAIAERDAAAAERDAYLARCGELAEKLLKLEKR